MRHNLHIFPDLVILVVYHPFASDGASDAFAYSCPPDVARVSGCVLMYEQRVREALTNRQYLPPPHGHLLDAFALVVTIRAAQGKLMHTALTFSQHAG